MIDQELIARKLTNLGGYLDRLRPLLEQSHEELAGSMLVHAAERMVQLAVDWAVDINLHLLEAAGHAIPQTYKESFLELGELGAYDRAFAERVARLAGLRNVLVHRYLDLDMNGFVRGLPEIVQVLEQYCAAIRAYALPES